ncbi:MAG: M56 family metallopeptidase [Anaerocolumna sp.]
MLSNVFLQILNMSFTASIVTILVLFVRLFLKKTPKVFSYALWLVVLIRLLIPFSFESIYSLIPTKIEPISQDIMFSNTPSVDTGVTIINNSVNALLPAPVGLVSVNPMQVWIFIGSSIWLSGIVIFITYHLIQLVRLWRRLKSASYYRERIFISDRIQTAFVMGIFRPHIYLPTNLRESEVDYILIHEQTHIKRLDHLMRLISFLALSIHWFNPVVWIAFGISGKDMEMSCDESVINKIGNHFKKDYSESLLTLATGRRMGVGTPLAFGEGDTIGRIKNVLKYKKPRFWMIGLSMIIVFFIGMGLLANPKDAAIILIEEEKQIELPDVDSVNRKENLEVIQYSEVTDSLENAVHLAIIEHNKNNSHPADLTCENHIILAIKEGESDSNNIDSLTITVYTMVRYAEFNLNNNGMIDNMEESSGSHIPTAITFKLGDDGGYILHEYWQPRDGSYYLSDLQNKFPQELWEEGLDTQKFIVAQEQSIYKSLIEGGYINSKEKITSLINDILTMSEDPSNWKLQALKRDLTYYGDYLLTYASTRFLEDNLSKDSAKILEDACRAILKQFNEDIGFSSDKTGREWFDAYLANLRTYELKEGMAYVKKNMPKGYLLCYNNQVIE